jgi:hypothetical protein
MGGKLVLNNLADTARSGIALALCGKPQSNMAAYGDCPPPHINVLFRIKKERNIQAFSFTFYSYFKSR